MAASMFHPSEKTYHTNRALAVVRALCVAAPRGRATRVPKRLVSAVVSTFVDILDDNRKLYARMGSIERVWVVFNVLLDNVSPWHFRHVSTLKGFQDNQSSSEKVSEQASAGRV